MKAEQEDYTGYAIERKREAENCLLCGKVKPIGHILIATNGGKNIGRICASHTLKEIILDRKSVLLSQSL